VAGLAAGRRWLETHADDLLPDALAFARLGFRAAGMPLPPRLAPSRAGRIARTVLPVSRDFDAVAAAVGRLHAAYRGDAPLAGPLTAARRAARARPLDRAAINRALAEAARGELSAASLQWMTRPLASGFGLTHQLLAWLLCVWSGGRDDAAARASALARAVRAETARRGGDHDLLAQQTAMLALGGWPAPGLAPLARRILERQDARDGGWHYFERRVSPAETFARVCEGRSALLGWPIPYEEERFGVLVRTMHHAHRGHATALSVCALGVWLRGRTTRDSSPSAPRRGARRAGPGSRRAARSPAGRRRGRP
jgi:hypothetical protein